MFNILNIFLIFYIFCFAGWIWETIFVSIQEKKFANRGFLNGPYLPIYGFGGLFIYLIFQKYSTTFFSITSIKIYIVGLILATIVEYITSFLMEKIFKARWWDYSNEFLNLNGRICLVASLFWGFLSVLFVQVINPIILSKLDLVSHDLKLIVVSSLTTAICIDFAVTTSAVLMLQTTITNILKYETEKIEDFKNKLNSLSELSDEHKKIINEYKNKLYIIQNPLVKRLVSAFPNLKFTSNKRQKIFDKIKEVRKNIKRKEK